MSGHRPRTTSFAETNKSHPPNFGGVKISREYRPFPFHNLANIQADLRVENRDYYLLRKFFNHTIGSKYDLTVHVVGDKDGSKVTTVVATTGSLPDRTQEISYTDTKVIGNGSFGVVYQARMCDSSELVAIKKVLQDKRFKVNIVSFVSILTTGYVSRYKLNFLRVRCHKMPKFNSPIMATSTFFFQNRELQIMRKLDHCNIVRLRWFFYSSGEKVCNLFFLILENVMSFFSSNISIVEYLDVFASVKRNPLKACYIVLFAPKRFRLDVKLVLKGLRGCTNTDCHNSLKLTILFTLVQKANGPHCVMDTKTRSNKALLAMYFFFAMYTP